MTKNRTASSRDDYIAVDHALYGAEGRYCVDDPALGIEVCHEPDDPEYSLEVCWHCWSETDAAGADCHTRGRVVVLLDSHHRHESGSSTVLFSVAERGGFLDTPDGMRPIPAGESPVIASAWIEVEGLRIESTRAGTAEYDFHCVVAEVGDDVAIALLEKIAQGGLPAIKFRFEDEACGRIFQFIKPISRAQGSRIEAQISIVKQMLAARARPGQ